MRMACGPSAIKLPATTACYASMYPIPPTPLLVLTISHSSHNSTYSLCPTGQVSRALLLRERDMPLSTQPFSGCCDTLVARCKQASSTLTTIESQLSSGTFLSICSPLAKLAETVSVITEAVAQAVYMVAEKNPKCKQAKPGIIDNYPLTR